MPIRLGLRGQHWCRDAGYDYRPIRQLVDPFDFTRPLRKRGAEKEARKVGQQARRWGVEGAHSGRNRYRRLLIRGEKKPEVYWSLRYFAGAILIWHKVLTHSQTTPT